MATHSAYSHFLLITIQHYLIKYKRTKQNFANDIFNSTIAIYENYDILLVN